MEEKGKQRLIGIIVIVAALFIVLPFLFHNSRPTADKPASTPTVTLPAASNSTDATSTTNTSNTQNTVNTQNTATTDAATNSAAQSVTTTDAATNTPSTPTTPTTPTTPATATPAATPAAMPATPAPATTLDTSASSTATTDATTQPATSPETQNSDSSKAIFSAPPSSLTTGQPNEGPVQPNGTDATPTPTPTPTPTSTPTPAKTSLETHRTINHVAARKTEEKRVVSRGPAYEIQLAVFSEEANALHLTTMLRAHHYAAFTRRIVVNDRALTAVFVGPEANLNRAEMVKRNLQRAYQLNGEIKKYHA